MCNNFLISTTKQAKIKIMTLENALTHFKNLKSGSTKKAEIKVYQQFIQILMSLQERNLSGPDVQSIEQVLDGLELNSATPKNNRFYTKALRQFQKYLKDTYSLTTKRYYTQMGLGLGASFGVVFGVVVLPNFERSLGISMGISLGMIIGLVIGHHLDAQAMASGKVL